ncbi:hypothetical protein E2986_04451 [Frieseomelitta varia]|uniref:Uncharacterized protein n=1 Tax=Frieseomelitta varia TaxID=561572 RepID=A0A833RSX0_9HYME|nr:uncharacterized protein LOC122535373 [Frieseomelitta varia]KAF3422445.1 hypothetical protein E2986_04451 [Frieseomelitta varia]
MEEVTKCRYIDCVDIREKEQILHELPVCDTGLCVRWLINSGHVDLIGSDLDVLRSMKFFICNNHFTEDCYLSKGTLKENAVPSPHWSAVSRTLRNLKIRRKIQLNGQESSMERVTTDQAAEKNAPSEFEVDQWCRTCATKKQNLVSMTTKGKGTDMSLLSKLKLLIEIDDEDDLPTKMCDECVDKLEQSFKFFQQIYVADNTLRHVFPNTRSSNAPRKPLRSIGEHMRNEQKEKEKGQEEEQLQLQQIQDRAPKVTRGIFRRGRGRPRTRGYAARARARQRSAQISASITNTSNTTNANLNDNKVYERRANETSVLKSDAQSAMHDEERQGDTVFSLLTDTCHSDEELDWSDVLKVMSDQRYKHVVSRQKTETKLEDKVQKNKTEEQVRESNVTPLQAEATKMETTAKRETAIETKDKVQEALEVEIEAEAEAEAEPMAESGAEPEAEAQVKMETEAEVQSNKVVAKLAREKKVPQIRCQFCDKSFKLRRRLQTHLLDSHSQISGYMCVDCLICYETRLLLLNHRNLHHGDRRYRCEHCHQEFLEKRALREHIKKCESQGATRYSCDSCESIDAFSSKQELIDHMKIHPEVSPVTFHTELDNLRKTENELASSVETTVKLDPCTQSEYSPSVAPSKDTVIDEITMSNPDEKSGSSAVDSSNLFKANITEETQPALTSGEESAMMVICPDCNEQMHDTVELSLHRMRRHSMNRKDATCLLCDNKSFSSLDEYEQHVLDHCKRLRISP